MFQALKDNPAAFGKDYQLTELPRNGTGEVLYQSSSPEDYLAYVEWLADYLYTVKPQPSPRQQELCELAQCGPPEWPSNRSPWKVPSMTTQCCLSGLA